MVSTHKNAKSSKGFILPLSMILALVVLTSIGLWYRQIVVQSYLSERLIHQRSLYIECRSLLPVLIQKLDEKEEKDLLQAEEDFLNVEEQGNIRWKVDRSAAFGSKIRFTFKLTNSSMEPIRLTIPYSKQ